MVNHQYKLGLIFHQISQHGNTKNYEYYLLIIPESTGYTVVVVRFLLKSCVALCFTPELSNVSNFCCVKYLDETPANI